MLEAVGVGGHLVNDTLFAFVGGEDQHLSEVGGAPGHAAPAVHLLLQAGDAAHSGLRGALVIPEAGFLRLLG